MAEPLAGTFPDFTVEIFPDRHHFDPPHRIEPTRVAAFCDLLGPGSSTLERVPTAPRVAARPAPDAGSPAAGSASFAKRVSPSRSGRRGRPPASGPAWFGFAVIVFGSLIGAAFALSGMATEACARLDRAV